MTKLAVSLAERFNGEIINGDALQMYEGLPITTNKISIEERKGIPHHLLGCVKLGDDPWTVLQFCTRANSIIEEIRSRGKLPVVVGGTHYYLQALLFPKSLVGDDVPTQHIDEEEEERKWPILAAESETMLDELKKVDPEMAQGWHPRDRRKIRRSLQIWLQTGRKASEVYREQKSVSPKLNSDLNRHAGDLEEAESLQHQDPLVFWTYSSPLTLNQRLDKRVDSMMSNGLLDEVRSMHHYLQDHTVDDNRGIWIAIGCKEMLPYIANPDPTGKEKDEGIERTKIATRQYAKRQNRWIRLKLLHAAQQAGLGRKVFLLHSTDVEHFSTNVEETADNITSSFLAGTALPSPSTLSDAAKEMMLLASKETRNAQHCEACDKTLMSEAEWLGHLTSKGHKRAMKPKVDWQTLYPKNDHI